MLPNSKAGYVATLCDHVGDVVGVRAFDEMVGVNAAHSVTAMHRNHASAERAPKGALQDKATQSAQPSINHDSWVVSRTPNRPINAAVGANERPQRNVSPHVIASLATTSRQRWVNAAAQSAMAFTAQAESLMRSIWMTVRETTFVEALLSSADQSPNAASTGHLFAACLDPRLRRGLAAYRNAVRKHGVERAVVVTRAAHDAVFEHAPFYQMERA